MGTELNSMLGQPRNDVKSLSAAKTSKDNPNLEWAGIWQAPRRPMISGPPGTWRVVHCLPALNSPGALKTRFLSASADPSEFRISMGGNWHVLALTQVVLMVSKPWEPLSSQYVFFLLLLPLTN